MRTARSVPVPALLLLLLVVHPRVAQPCPGVHHPADLEVAEAVQRVATTHAVTLQIEDELGNPLVVRAHVRDGADVDWPGGPDGAHLSHRDWPWMRGYFYVDGSVTMDLAPGVANVIVGRGFEWQPVELASSIRGDQLLQIQLTRVFDMRAEGWHGGDVHVHAAHSPSDYTVTPVGVMRVVEAEDLAMTWILNSLGEWTGAVHPFSTPEHQIYYSIEHRNQAYGHVCLVGLAQPVGIGCCTPPAPAYPMLSMFREGWSPGSGEAMTLTHPCTGAGFLEDDGWPAWGLGRELPVLATSGNLDALDIASYSNLPDNVALEAYYALLDCGLKIPPSAGTDTALNFYWNRPAGGYRVYVHTASASLTPEDWVTHYKAGRVFVTNYPLIPEFSVNGAMAGSTLVVSPGSKMTISARIQSVLPVDTAEIVVNGEVQESVSIPLEGAWTDFQLDRTLAVDESSWIALRVRGQTTVRHASSENLFAHSGPMYVEVDGAPVRRTASAPRFIDWADSLRLFVLARGNITLDQRNEVFERIQASEDTFRSLFQEPPEAFDLLDPAPDAHLNPFLSVLLTWAASHDPEEGDRIVYTCELRDSLGTVASFETADTTFVLPNPPLLMGALEWRVIATDLGGNEVTSTGGWRPLTLEPPVSGLPLPGDGLPTEVPEAPERIRIGAHPNPFHAQVELRWMPGDPGPLAGAKVFDAAGRRVRWIGGDAGSGSTPRSDAASSSSADGARLVWDGRDDRFQQVPPGVYWVRVETSSGQRASVRVTRLR